MTNSSEPSIEYSSHSVFPKSDKPITRVGLGGEGVLRTTGRNQEARDVIDEAVQQGISYYDSARVYMDSERYYGDYWGNNTGQREKIFHTSKSAQRSREGALAELSQTLERLNTSYLDLWQIHDIRSERDLELISQKGGALEAFIEAREMGLARHIGVTGHHDPDILTRAVEKWPVDAVLMPVNPAEQVLGGFLTRTLEAAHRKGIAVIGMKVLGGRHYISPEAGLSAGLLIRFALSYDITTAIVGCSTVEEVRVLAEAGRSQTAITAGEKKEISQIFKSHARRMAFYRGSVFDTP